MGNFTRAAKRPKILVAPLDWGLGHATRCIPIIYELINLSCEVIIATAGDQERLLMDEFPLLKFVKLDGYKVRYGRTGFTTSFFIGLQIPKIFRKIRSENRWLNQFIVTEQPDAIISDNRYGLYANEIPSILITHQIHIKTGFGKNLDHVLQKISHRYIRKFSACWIPDNKGQSSLAGSLSNPPTISGIQTVMLGPISRFRPCQNQVHEYILILLSGPEPQRMILEKKLLGLAKFIGTRIIMVRGLPLETNLPDSPPNITILNHAGTDQLNRLICGAEFVISRSGYTTIMDLMLLGKKSILIPTPGQAEQEWLASWLFQNNLAYSIRQENLNAEILDEAKSFKYISYETTDPSALRNTLSELLHKIADCKK
jgi:uncharacterized protein (TIGR00661 family)